MIKPVCPHCIADLDRHRAHSTNYYSCPNDHGSAISLYSLKQLVNWSGLNALWLRSVDAPEIHMACSHCRKPYRQIVAELPEAQVELEVCRRCQFIWLDQSEIEEFPKREFKSSTPEAEKAFALENIKFQQEKVDHKPFTLDKDLELHKVLRALVGLPVEAESDQLRAEPLITWMLLGITILTSLLSLRHQEWFNLFALMPGHSTLHKALNTFSVFFVHADLWHLFGNMYFLWVFGDNVEDELGSSNYLWLVFLATIVGTVVYMMFFPLNVGLVGASGGISGVVAFYILRFPYRKFVWAIWFGRIHSFRISAWLLGVLFFGKDFLAMAAQFKGATNVSHISHLAGAAVGVFFFLLMSPNKSSLSRSERGRLAKSA